MVLIGIVYVGACVYGNYFAATTNPYKIPDVEKARYSITVKNTGNLLYSNDVEENGSFVIIQGFWELQGQKFVYKDTQIILNSEIFGPIAVKERIR